ncbi:MAG: M48 family metallopeptidase, partial [gamma proteobacterium symbiont of Ctena orbiculata]
GRSRIKFTESLDRCSLQFQRMGYAPPAIHIGRMKTRWGSLSSRGLLTLNRDLIRAPRECIDYVVTHELCHLKHKDHSRAFYRLLEQVMPDWDKRKHRLELALV